jgi:hypothetical protein
MNGTASFHEVFRREPGIDWTPTRLSPGALLSAVPSGGATGSLQEAEYSSYG